MVRIPLGNEKSARVEVRSIAPTPTRISRSTRCCARAIEGPVPADAGRPRIRRSRTAVPCPTTSTTHPPFKSSDYVTELLGADVQTKFAEVKQLSADRCPKALGSVHQDSRGSVPPRGDESVSVEQVLDGKKTEARRAPYRLSEARSQKGPLRLSEARRKQAARGVYFLLLASCFLLLASCFLLLAPCFLLLSSAPVRAIRVGWVPP